MSPISMIERVAALALLVAAVSSPCAAQKPADTAKAAGTPPAKSIHAVFECASGKSITADFVQGDPSKVKLFLSDGRSISLSQTRSGSGARYANVGETVVFWNKGNTAFLEEKGKTSYADCSTS